MPRRILEFTGQHLIEMGAVVNAGQCVAAGLLFQFERAGGGGLRDGAQRVDFTQCVQAAQHEHFARLLEDQLGVLLGERLAVEYGLGLRDHGADGAQHLTECHLVEAQAALAALRRFCKAALLRVQDEQIRHGTR